MTESKEPLGDKIFVCSNKECFRYVKVQALRGVWKEIKEDAPIQQYVQ